MDALRLVSTPQRGYSFRETIWVDPSTYLPVRASVTFPHSRGRSSQLVLDFRWLEPTAANLAALHAAVHRAPIPAGFRPLPATI